MALHLLVDAASPDIPEMTYELTRGVYALGRKEASNDIVLGNPFVSRSHAMLAVDGDDVVVLDVGSTKGTFVDGCRLLTEEVARLTTANTLRLPGFLLHLAESPPPERVPRLIMPRIHRNDEELLRELFASAPPPPPTTASSGSLDPENLWPDQPPTDMFATDGAETDSLTEAPTVEGVLDAGPLLGPLQDAFDDEAVRQLDVRASGDVFTTGEDGVEHMSGLQLDAEAVDGMLLQLGEAAGVPIGPEQPFLDSYLPEEKMVVRGSLAVGGSSGPMLRLRRCATACQRLSDLRAKEFLDERAVAFLETCLNHRVSLVIVGAPGVGRTTLAGALAGCLSAQERLAVVEDAPELALPHEHLVRLLSPRHADAVNGSPARTEALRLAIDLDADRLLLDEVHGLEVFDLLLAMSTGHKGSIAVCRATSANDALTGLVTAAGAGAPELPPLALRRQVAAGAGLLLWLDRGPGGERRLGSISEPVLSNDERLALQPIFDRCAGASPEESLAPTGAIPSFADDEISYPRRWFEA